MHRFTQTFQLQATCFSNLKQTHYSKTWPSQGNTTKALSQSRVGSNCSTPYRITVKSVPEFCPRVCTSSLRPLRNHHVRHALGERMTNADPSNASIPLLDWMLWSIWTRTIGPFLVTAYATEMFHSWCPRSLSHGFHASSGLTMQFLPLVHFIQHLYASKLLCATFPSWPMRDPMILKFDHVVFHVPT